MIPVTRKELYLNKIVGNDDYSVPEKPISEEELFFAEILGEAVQAPEPLPRYQMYLAKIAKRDIEIPYPETRLEYFLARAAGMDVETPVPITREEIYWSNYAAIVDFEVEGVPPLTYKAIEGTLENYRIYGNTIDGESVGDRTANLWNVEVVDNYSSNSNGKINPYVGRCTNIEPIVVDGNSYILSYSAPSNASCVVMIKNSGELISRVFKLGSIIMIDTSGGNELYITWLINDTTSITSDMIQDIMLNIGSTPLPYEPYGYRVPVTVANGTDTETTNIYLDEQLTKSGDNADYIDYNAQKRYNVDGTFADVTLPALLTLSGTNTLSVGTEVQPSKVYIKGEKEREYT